MTWYFRPNYIANKPRSILRRSASFQILRWRTFPSCYCAGFLLHLVRFHSELSERPYVVNILGKTIKSTDNVQSAQGASPDRHNELFALIGPNFTWSQIWRSPKGFPNIQLVFSRVSSGGTTASEDFFKLPSCGGTRLWTAFEDFECLLSKLKHFLQVATCSMCHGRAHLMFWKCAHCSWQAPMKRGL